jgi:ABC-2 type transport system ATP-binding protein
LIEIKNLVKKYKNIIAVDNTNLKINDNEIFGLLGPNGAGKTTLIHILATLIKPSSGTAIINGYDIINEASKVRSSIGIVFQAPSSDDILTGYENLKIHSLLYNVDSHIREKRISDVLELVGLTNRKNDQVKKYSGGMRRRLEIARGLLHKPKVIFLDEPTLGLDPNSRESMWKYIKRLVDEEKITIILTTHYMEEADLLCNRIGFIDKGKIIALNSPSKLKANIGGEIINLKIENKEMDNIEKIMDLIKKFDFVHRVENFETKGEKGKFAIYVDNASNNLPIIMKVINKMLNDIDISSVDYRRPTLNDVFLRLTGRHIEDQYDKDSAEGGFMERYAQYAKK